MTTDRRHLSKTLEAMRDAVPHAVCVDGGHRRLLRWCMPGRPKNGDTHDHSTLAKKTLGRLHTLGDDGTRAISTDNRTLDRWDTSITESRRKPCIGIMNPRTKPVEVR